MKCSNCGASNPADAKFCGGCGQELEAAESSGAAGKSTWENVFKWIGIVVVGFVVLVFLAGL